MEIHRPKAAHSWREFLIEIGTIICGILIALGLEQSLEVIHEHRIADEAREAVRAEVRENLYWMGQRALKDDCVRKRLGELQELLANARADRSHPVPQHLGLLPHMKLTDERWLASGHAGRTSLFPPEEQGYFGNIYFTTNDLKSAQDSEEAVWSKLMALQGVDNMTPYEAHDFSVLLAQAKYYNYMVLLGVRRAHQWAERLHLSPEKSWTFDEKRGRYYSEICQPLSAPRDLAALAASDDQIGRPEDLP